MKNTRCWSWALIKVVTNSGDSTVNTGENSISEPATVRGRVACADSRQRGTAHPRAKFCLPCSFSYLIGLIVHLVRVQVCRCRINLPIFSWQPKFVTDEVCLLLRGLTVSLFCLFFFAKNQNPPLDTVLSPLCLPFRPEIYFDCIQLSPWSSKW
jgi:hypothetical protein